MSSEEEGGERKKSGCTESRKTESVRWIRERRGV